MIVRPKGPNKLPYVLSKTKILSIMDQVVNLKHKTILLTAYSSGLRISEALSLRISDIDSKNMLLRVNLGKPKSLSPAQAKAFHRIRLCRTPSLGSHALVSEECGSMDVSFNSCRDRHCPKCQHSVQKKWVEAQMSKLLPVGYFHVVFTIPQELN